LKADEVIDSSKYCFLFSSPILFFITCHN